MTRFLLLVLLAAQAPYNSIAQQAALSALHQLDVSRMVGAAAGLEGIQMATLSYRDQWSNLPGQPSYYRAGWSSPAKRLNGAYCFHASVDQLGLQSASGFKASYNQVFTTGIVLFSTGIGLGFDHRNWDGSQIRTPDGIYGNQGFDHKDPNLSLGQMSHRVFEICPSVYIQTTIMDVGLEFGVPLAQFSGPVGGVFNKNYSFRSLLYREYNIKKFVLSGQLFVYSDFIQTQSELYIKADYNANLFAAISLRGYNSKSLDAIGSQLGIKVYSQLWLIIGVELPLNVLRNQISGLNQDFGLKYVWNIKNSATRIPTIYNPRW
ncbi:MAG: type IX secretion system membrane protein PorP/SprF [Saprospiraceae bacterium]|nr:type IX secretion system membrane protein PorP/SprF [Saprospiraceae bacterium]